MWTSSRPPRRPATSETPALCPGVVCPATANACAKSDVGDAHALADLLRTGGH